MWLFVFQCTFASIRNHRLSVQEPVRNRSKKNLPFRSHPRVASGLGCFGDEIRANPKPTPFRKRECVIAKIFEQCFSLFFIHPQKTPVTNEPSALPAPDIYARQKFRSNWSAFGTPPPRGWFVQTGTSKGYLRSQVAPGR